MAGSLISRTVSVDVKHHVYLLTYTGRTDQDQVLKGEICVTDSTSSGVCTRKLSPALEQSTNQPLYQGPSPSVRRQISHLILPICISCATAHRKSGDNGKGWAVLACFPDNEAVFVWQFIFLMRLPRVPPSRQPMKTKHACACVCICLLPCLLVRTPVCVRVCLCVCPTECVCVHINICTY